MSSTKAHNVDWNPSDMVPDANKIQDLKQPSPRGDSGEKARCQWSSSSRAAGWVVRTAEQGQASCQTGRDIGRNQGTMSSREGMGETHSVNKHRLCYFKKANIQ